MAEALLEHQQAADTAVAVLEGTDALKLYMKIQEVTERMSAVMPFLSMPVCTLCSYWQESSGSGLIWP